MKACFSTEASGKAIGRRTVLRFGMAAVVGLTANPALATLETDRERKLSLHNLHTGESICTTFWADGVFQIDALRDIDFVLRDFRTGEVSEIDPQLLVLLHGITEATGMEESFQVISGYRSPETNATLASNSGGVAKRSLHMQGMAIDIRLPGVQLRDLRDLTRRCNSN